MRQLLQQALDALENALDDSRDRLGNYIATYGENSTYRPHRIVALRKTVSDGEAAIESLKAELAKPEPTTWLPIESAPKETEVFIGAFVDDVFKFGKAELFYEQGNVFEGETFSGWVWSVDDCSESVAEQPSYWMPLPTPPTYTAPPKPTEIEGHPV